MKRKEKEKNQALLPSLIFNSLLMAFAQTQEELIISAEGEKFICSYHVTFAHFDM